MDIAHKETDKIIAKIEKEIAAEYKQAHKEISAKLNDYLRRFKIKDEKWREWVKNGTRTRKEYLEWRKGQILIGKRWMEMKETLAADYANAYKIADSIAKGYRPDVYALNHNYATFQVEHDSLVDTSYTLYNREAVERMYRENPKLYSSKMGKKVRNQIKEGKLKRWERRKIQSVLTQAVLQGESIPNITKRLEGLTAGDHKAAIRNARTMMTGVENAGRLDAYARAKSMGISVMKQWVATLDSRTRHWHRQLDGVRVEVEEPFENEKGEIMFPGDPDADGANIYNCRCGLKGSIEGFETDTTDLNLRYDKNLEHMSYEEWKNDRKAKSNPITLPEEKAKSIRASYVKAYKGDGSGMNRRKRR